METLQELNFTQIIAVVTVLSSSISIIISKIFENYQNSLKHKRILKEKLIDSKLDACKNAIKYYGTFLNYLYNSKSNLESLDSYNYSLLLSESGKLYEDSLKKITLDADFYQINLFYDFYGLEDEKIAEELKNMQKNYFEFVHDIDRNKNFKEEKELRIKLINSTGSAINYFKIKIKMVRDDLQKNME